MKQSSIYFIGIISIYFIVFLCGSLYADIDPAIREQLDKLLVAVQHNDYETFIADGTEMFKENITQQIFNVVSVQLSWRLEEGYEAIYLDALHQQGSRVYLWKLVFADGGDDVLAKLVIKDDTVAGFWLQ